MLAAVCICWKVFPVPAPAIDEGLMRVFEKRASMPGLPPIVPDAGEA